MTNLKGLVFSLDLNLKNNIYFRAPILYGFVTQDPALYR